ncbi:MAG: DUF3379 family protein [Sedimenticolaceae bacterium]
MNCLDFRRRMLADPFCRDEDILAHESECPACAPFAREVRAQEVHLRSALQDIAPPQGMAERIQLAARFDQRATVRRRWWYSAAATVLMTIGVSMVSLFSTSLDRSNVALAQSVINHIEDESNHLREARPVSVGRLNHVFERFGAHLAGNLGTVNFAAECVMRKRNGVHLVMPGKMGPITVFFMPGEMTEAEMPVSSARFSGRIVPTSWGSIAVVGESGESLDGLGERMAAAVDWPQQDLAGSDLFRRGGLATTPLVAQQQDS